MTAGTLPERCAVAREEATKVGHAVSSPKWKTDNLGYYKLCARCERHVAVNRDGVIWFPSLCTSGLWVQTWRRIDVDGTVREWSPSVSNERDS